MPFGAGVSSSAKGQDPNRVKTKRAHHREDVAGRASGPNSLLTCWR